MREETVQRLLALNRSFYRDLAAPFSQSRSRPQPGFTRLLDYLPRPCHALLDVGCGDGRLGAFLFGHDAIGHYTGVDSSPELLLIAASAAPGDFYQRELTQEDCLADLGRFDATACLAVLQHIPARSNRVRLLKEMAGCLAPRAPLILTTWQFADNPRLRRKVRPWSAVDIAEDDVEPGDHLLTWQRGGFGFRYVTYIDEAETERLAQETGLTIAAQFRSDGKEGDLNLYTVFNIS